MFACMMAGQGQASNLRDPPAWDPAMAATYPFRDWTRDVMHWSVLNGQMNSAQKAAAIAMRLKGSAKRLVRQIPPQVLINGAVINGVQIDPLGFLMHALSEPFQRLGEEQNLSAISDIMNFDAIPGERVEDLLIRFDEALDRGQEYGNVNLDVTSCVWLLIRSLRLSQPQFQQLLQRFNGRLPQTDQEFQDMRIWIRQMGHIIENHPGNIASTLRVNQGQQQRNQTQAYVGFPSNQNDTPQMPNFGGGWSGWVDGQSSQSSNVPGNPSQSQTYLTQNDVESGTDTDTESSLGDDDYSDMIPAGTPEHEVEGLLFWAYSRAKAAWRNFTRKPVRRVRRFYRRKGKGKGKGMGRRTVKVQQRHS